MDRFAQQALEHIHLLSVGIGARGSCRPGERRAAEAVLEQMRALGAGSASLEPFRGAPSTYLPYVLAFSAALAGTLLAWLAAGRWGLACAALLHAMGAAGMLSEADLGGSWMRRCLPRAASQNAVGVLRPAGPVRRRAVLCAHLDTHRTAVFYSSPAWNRLFVPLVAGALLSMVVGAAGYAAGAALDWDGARWIGLGACPMELFALGLCLLADRAPFSPGANDDASGVGAVLALARRLSEEPLETTEVWLALAGCEEVGVYGMAAFVEAHGPELGRDALYLVFDQVGIGGLTYLSNDGLILKRRTHPQALELARRAAAALPGLAVRPVPGLAYTDALVATKRGLVALTLSALPAPASGQSTHWHQMSDTAGQIDPQSLADACAFAWELLHQLDRPEGRLDLP